MLRQIAPHSGRFNGRKTPWRFGEDCLKVLAGRLSWDTCPRPSFSSFRHAMFPVRYIDWLVTGSTKGSLLNAVNARAIAIEGLGLGLSVTGIARRQRDRLPFHSEAPTAREID